MKEFLEELRNQGLISEYWFKKLSPKESKCKSISVDTERKAVSR